MRIIPDEENNLLVVVAPPHEWNIISRILKQLDIMPRQVLCEVLIAEVTLTDQLKYGIEFLTWGHPGHHLKHRDRHFHQPQWRFGVQYI